ncbi:hypothetical protein GCM10016455_05490 [Aliiroseovarius zhejiangensis]|uniref:Putative tail fiber protein gp53-like C-terminal domain-containing protein n=1 Tax=Aliiroseovarius zhejiangensis TaxID=1632025 RepID=A0ABQ3IQV0_9RHOB|nr:pyocin knob domain-containing protein [Aliiroseovarius zhejiangensis]GHE88256.1 hypothetical protein GCM10016455_05490 [Aliiroseovarius zhejiangensis]
MADLSESAGWVSGIYQIETTDPVVGGPPNLGAGQGIANVQAAQLASRTKYLKDQTAGFNQEAIDLSSGVDDLDVISASGIYLANATTTGRPSGAASIYVLHEEGTAGASQIATDADGDAFFRLRTGSSWSLWQQLVTMTDYASNSMTTAGFQILPSGLILQWGSSGMSSGSGEADATFPITFPNDVFKVIAQETTSTASGTSGVRMVGWVPDQTTTASCRFFVVNASGNPVSGENVSYLAIGH